MQVVGHTIPILAPVGHLPLRIRPAIPMTDDALLDFCRANRSLRIERTKEGELVIMSPTGGETGHRSFQITVRVGAWVEKDGTGIGFDSSAGFILPNGAERAPDFAWVRRSRWFALTTEAREKFVPLCPDFVIELRSPSSSMTDLHAKMQEYMDCGALLGWLIDPKSRQVFVYEQGAEPRRLDQPETISGDRVLPGLVLKLSDLW